MPMISAETFRAIKADIGRIEELTQDVRDSGGIDPCDMDLRIIKLAESIQLLASCVDLLAMKVRNQHGSA